MAALSPFLMATYPDPAVTFVRGEGTVLWDDQGRRYLDFLSGLGVTSLGHAHPAVAEALATQAATLLHVSNLYGTTIAPEVAARLDALLSYPDGAPTPSSSPGRGPHPRPAPSALSYPDGAPTPSSSPGRGPAPSRPNGRVFFCNSGAEANECAFKLARKWGGPGRHVVVSTYGSFHGRTLAALHATGQPEKHEAFQPLPEGFRHVAWCDAAALEAALTPEVAAVILEPVLGEGGVRPGTPQFFTAARRLCDERGILLVIDEVQTGLGRTGRWFGFQHYGIEPDVVTMAKSLGNGVPIGACWARAEVADAFAPGDHATTFGGQPLAASAARAVLRVMEEEDAPARAEAAGARLSKALGALPGVAEVRGLGLLLAVELAGGAASRDVAAAALDAGLVVNPVTSSALRLAPPLLVSDEEIDEGVDILARVLATAPGGDGAPASARRTGLGPRPGNRAEKAPGGDGAPASARRTGLGPRPGNRAEKAPGGDGVAGSARRPGP